MLGEQDLEDSLCVSEMALQAHSAFVDEAEALGRDKQKVIERPETQLMLQKRLHVIEWDQACHTCQLEWFNRTGKDISNGTQ